MNRILTLIGFALLGGEPESVRLEAIRDLWISNVGSEAGGNNGAAPRLKLKSIQEMSLIDIDPAPLNGRVIRKATLFLKSAGEPRLKRVSVGGIASEWVEGTGSSYEKQPGSSTHNHRRHPNEAWTGDGGDFCDVMFGFHGALWGSADASPPDKDGWQAISVDPRIVAARVANVSKGFILYDDTGTEWRRDGDKFELIHMPNRFVYSRDQNRASAPYFVVEFDGGDKTPPAPVGEIQSTPDPSGPGGTILSWTTPADRGRAGTVGFLVASTTIEVPLDRVPLAKRPGQRVEMRLDNSRKPSVSEAVVTVSAIDGAGNTSPPTAVRVRFPDRKTKPLPDPVVLPILDRPGPLPRLGSAEIAILDELDKVQPVSGEMIPAHPQGYLVANHLWDSARRTVGLHAAKNEFVAFQVMLKGPSKGVTAKLEFEDAPKIAATIGRYHSVESKRGPLPDPITAVTGPIDVPESGHTSESLHVEIYIPHAIKAGRHRGQLTLASGNDRLTLPVNLEVWDFTLPDSLSFLPEMNCYGLPENERDYYRLGHAHRVVLNRVPYSHNGRVHDGFAPRWDGKTIDWTAWDKRFGPLLDGSAFSDLPRKGVPIECFYLPLFENWPTPIDPNYNGDYWADRAFTASYRRAFVEVSRQIAEHLRSKHFDETLLECFFNGKHDFKRNGWSRATSPWLLDEPANFQDFWALRYFGQAFHEGINLAAPGKAKLVFRADISRPQWQRDILDDVLDVNVCGSVFRRYRPMVLERKERLGHVLFEYGSTNPIEESNLQPAAWTLDLWTLGADGVLPWQTIGEAGSWTKADELSLFYPGHDGGPPVPSVRLKAYRRGQQDVEYLTLFSQTTGSPRWAVASQVRETLKLAGERRGTGSAGEDAGRIDYDKLAPSDLWSLRMRIGTALSASHPLAKRKLVDLRTPRRDPGPLQAKFVEPKG